MGIWVFKAKLVQRVNTMVLLGLLVLLAQICLSHEKHHDRHASSGHASSGPMAFSHLPVIPAALPAIAVDPAYSKHIPRKLWIAVKDRNDPLPSHLKELFAANPLWSVHICDNACKDAFMANEFANTSVAAIYNLINPQVGAARADVWRYAVLYTYGGVYLDDDSDMKTPFDDIISVTDKLIMSEEGASSLGDCYIPSFHLSDAFTYLTYFKSRAITTHSTGPSPSSPVSAAALPALTSTAPHFHMIKDNVPVFFHGNTLVNWGIFTAPRHPLFAATLTNIVHILSTEYHRQSVVHMTRWDAKWKQVMCSTGFVLTYTLRELELQQALAKEEIPRICTNNYKQYKGNVKAFWTGGDKDHYMKLMQRGGVHILSSLVPINLDKIAAFLSGRAVMGDAGKAIYLIKHGKKFTFGSYETFLKMGFTDRSVRHVADHILSLLPDGGDVSQSDLPPPPPPTGVAADVPFLRSVATAIDAANKTECFGDDYGGSRDDLLADRYAGYLQGHAVLVHPICMSTYQLGNTLGYLLNDMACANISGAHFIAVKKRFTLIQQQSLVTQGNAQYAFFNAIPDLLLSAAPGRVEEVKQAMRSKCTCLQFCWEHSEAPWLKALPLIRDVLLPAVTAYLQASNVQETVLDNATDRVYTAGVAIAPKTLPVVPDVTIQYRCGDNIGFGKTKYGLLPFSVYGHGDRIPVDVRHIFIIADSPGRSSAHVYSHRCETILTHLAVYLSKLRPAAVVVLKRGGDIFLDYARIVHSKVVFCSASTFCLWPAIANRAGHVYYPLTPLIAKAATNASAPNLGEHFHWIGEVVMIKQFKHYRPWTKLIDDLETMR